MNYNSYLYRVILSILISALWLTSAFAQTKTLQNVEELNTYFDSLSVAKMESLNIPGLTMVLVNRDSILYSGGWGHANLEEDRPATPDQTVWRLASISKVVTGTAVMQLVERGLVDLDTNINEYLTSVEIPETFNNPITLRHLLTHTPGLDVRCMGKSYRTEEEWEPLSEFIARILPDCVYPPGKVYSYSNIGNALSALVVEDVTGMDFNEYCIENIFRPLGMGNTSFRVQNREMEEQLYIGYVYQFGEYQPTRFDYLGDYPAGQLLSTSEDFARFMMAHLNGGSLNGNRILKTETVEQMHAPQFTHHPELSGSVGFTFHISHDRGYKISQHGGGYLGLSTLMQLFPDEGLGLFVAANVANSPVLFDISSALIDDILGAVPEERADESISEDNLPEYDPEVEKYKGYYRGTRYTREDMSKIFLLIGSISDMKLWSNDDGMLMMNDLEGNARRLIQTEPGLFKSIDDQYTMAFMLDDDGNPEFALTHGTGALEKVSVFWSTATQSVILPLLILFYLLTFFGFTVYAILPGNWKSKARNRPPLKLLRRLSYAAASLLTLHWVLMILVLFVLNPAHELTQTGLGYGMPGEMYAVQILPFAAIVALVYQAFILTRRTEWKELSLFSKGFYPMMLLISVLYLLVLHYWNLLGFRFG